MTEHRVFKRLNWGYFKTNFFCCLTLGIIITGEIAAYWTHDAKENWVDDVKKENIVLDLFEMRERAAELMCS